MGAGEIVDAAIRICRLHWKALCAIVAILSVPFTIIQSAVVNAAQHPTVVGGTSYVRDPAVGTVVAFAAVNALIISPLLRGAAVTAIGRIYLGDTPSAGSSIQGAAGHLGALILALFLVSLLIGLGLIALIVGGIFVYVRYSFVTEAIVIEDRRVGDALSRSWHLSKGCGWRILGTTILADILAGIVSAIVVLPASLLALQIGSGGWVVRAIGGSVASVITVPFLTTVGVILYFDARIRKEGFDLAVMASEIGAPPDSP